jgi:hypothetical protein
MDFSFVKNHWLGIVGALMCGIIIAAPNLIFMLSAEYKGIPMMYTDYETFYLSRLSAAYDGCSISCNPYIRDDHGKFPFFDPSISTYLLAQPGKALDLNAAEVQQLYNLIFPTILALLMYSLVFRLTSNKYWSTFGTLFMVLGFSLFNTYDTLGWQNIYDIFRGFVEYPRFLLYSRPVNPQFSSLIFLAYLHLLFSFSQNPSRKNFWALTFVYVFSFYVYFYTYTFLTFINLILIIVFLLFKKNEEAKRIAYCTLIGLVAGIPIAMEIFSLVNHPYYENLPKHGILSTHLPYISFRGVAFLALTVAAFLSVKKRVQAVNSEHYVLIALIASSFGIHNQHILTGRIVQYFHYDWYFTTPIFILCGIYILNILWQTPKKVEVPTIYTFIFLLIINAVFIQHSTYNQRLSETIAHQKIVPTLNYLNSLPPQSNLAIFGLDELSEIIPIFTSHYPLHANSMQFYLQPSTTPLENQKVESDYTIVHPRLYPSMEVSNQILYRDNESLVSR